MIIGYTCGVFDLIHVGHINLLKNAKSLCDKLIIGLSTDECIKYKLKNTVINYEDRKNILESIKYVDCVIPQINTDKFEAWKQIKYNILFVGNDWYNTPKWNTFEDKLKKVNVEIKYLPYTQKCSTTLIKKKIINRNNILILFSLNKILWDFDTNILTDKQFNEKLNNYQFTDDIIRIFKYLDLKSIKYGFISRSKYNNRCEKLLKKLSINLEKHFNCIMYTEEKSKEYHIKEIINTSNISPEFMILIDNDIENINSIRNIINNYKLIDSKTTLKFEDIMDIL